MPAENFVNVDGPNSAISLLVLGPSGSANVTSLGQTDPLERWQFLSSMLGDLDNDGDVDDDDLIILPGFVGITALSPGDRRDVNGDGKIDQLDISELCELAKGEVCLEPALRGEQTRRGAEEHRKPRRQLRS